jgi:hypothetical protein
MKTTVIFYSADGDELKEEKRISYQDDDTVVLPRPGELVDIGCGTKEVKCIKHEYASVNHFVLISMASRKQEV